MPEKPTTKTWWILYVEVSFGQFYHLSSTYFYRKREEGEKNSSLSLQVTINSRDDKDETEINREKPLRFFLWFWHFLMIQFVCTKSIYHFDDYIQTSFDISVDYNGFSVLIDFGTIHSTWIFCNKSWRLNECWRIWKIYAQTVNGNLVKCNDLITFIFWAITTTCQHTNKYNLDNSIASITNKCDFICSTHLNGKVWLHRLICRRLEVVVFVNVINNVRIYEYKFINARCDQTLLYI